jgi:hypothetical protein
MELILNPRSIEDYRLFLRVKRLPIYDVVGHKVWFPDEYAETIGLRHENRDDVPIEIAEHCFDYQRDGAIISIRKRAYAQFWRPGLGKTNAMFEFTRHARKVLPKQKRCLIVSPLMVIDQTLEEAAKFYPQVAIEQVRARDLETWLRGEGGIGITNYEAMTDGLDRGNLGMMACDESSLLKSHYGKWGQVILKLGRGLDWKLCLTGTPAPNDRIEFANHAVFLDHHPNVNSFLARYFVNRGETQERWELKPHALEPFYRGLSHWSLFINDPSTYGWVGNAKELPPIRVHVDHYEMTPEQSAAYKQLTGNLLVCRPGGIGSRSKLAQIAKGRHAGEGVATEKYNEIRKLVESWPDESTIIWCKFNPEQERMAREFPQAASLDGRTPHDERMRLLREFKAGRIKVLISKPKLMQFGLNLQVVTRHVWSTLQDSWEEFWQGCCRSNRVGSTKPLDVHIPCNDLERPMVDNVLRKASRINEDMAEQEAIFKRCGLLNWRNDDGRSKTYL